MTIKSWIDEFVPEMFLATKSRCMTDLECVDHCIQKWTGLKSKNTEKHELNYNDYILQDLDTFDSLAINNQTCALCLKYKETFSSRCYDHTMEEVCPFIRATGRRCDSPNGPWEASSCSPNTMLKALQYVRNYVLAETLADNTD